MYWASTFALPLPTLFVHGSTACSAFSHPAAAFTQTIRGRLSPFPTSCHSPSNPWRRTYVIPPYSKRCFIETPISSVTALAILSSYRNRQRTNRCAKKTKRLRTDFSHSKLKNKISRNCDDANILSNNFNVLPLDSMESFEPVEPLDDRGFANDSVMEPYSTAPFDGKDCTTESRAGTNDKYMTSITKPRITDKNLYDDDISEGALPEKNNFQNADSINADSMRWYLQVIGQDRLLRAEEEIELGRLIRCLMHWEVARSGLSSTIGRTASDDELADSLFIDRDRFSDMLRDAKRAKDRMIVCNLRLVVSIAKRYINRGLPLPDLIQEGTLGLIRACEKFDADKGFKFSTYATWWVRQAVSRSIADQSRTIRLPVHLYDTITSIRRATKVLSVELGRPPHEPELAEYCNITIEKLRMARVSMQHSVPLDRPLSAQEDAPMLSDTIESDEDSPEDLVDWSLLRDDLEHVVNSLTPRERDVVRMRYGLDDGRAKTLQEIGKTFDVSKERVRQIESRALRKLRHPYRADVLRQYAPPDW